MTIKEEQCYSTVTDWLKRDVSCDSIMMTFTIRIRTSELTQIVHYSGYQQKLYNEVKRLKEIGDTDLERQATYYMKRVIDLLGQILF